MVNSNSITTYIGTYTRRESFVDGKAKGIYIYHLDPSSGELTYAATVAGARHDQPIVSDREPGQKVSVRGQRDHRGQRPARDCKCLCHRSSDQAS